LTCSRTARAANAAETPNLMSWGYLLNNAQAFLYRAWWLPAFPGLAIVITVLGVALILERLQ
jgi:ABC-type dipeptide/oligopeptide/nickel transport system permease subunit